MTHRIRDYTCRVLELMDEGVLDPRAAAEAALQWLSESDVQDLVERYEWLPEDEDEPDEEDSD